MIREIELENGCNGGDRRGGREDERKQDEESTEVEEGEMYKRERKGMA